MDSSVLFAAVLSPTGGAFRIFREAHERHIELCISPHVLTEVREALVEKYPENLEALHALLLHFTPRILPEPGVRLVEWCLAFLPLGDAPILAAAIKAKVNVLVTLDQKHFLHNEKLAALKRPFSIMTPGDLIKEYFV